VTSPRPCGRSSSRPISKPELSNVFSTYDANSPQVHLDIDRNKAQILGVVVSDIFLALQATMGAYYINQFNAYSRVWQVNVQADASDRSRLNDIFRVNVANAKGDMIPLRSLMTAEVIVGPQLNTRYINLRAVNFNCTAAPGRSPGEAVAAMARTSLKVPPPGSALHGAAGATGSRTDGLHPRHRVRVRLSLPGGAL
jgi:hydrophobic/amphiphilic exporter-1 (mainly G- bacteria), HAE1 family